MSKSVQVHPDWWAMLSGATAQAVDVILRMQHTRKAGALSRSEAANWLQESLEYRLDHEAMAIHLAPAGYQSKADFYARGRAELGDAKFDQIVDDMAATQMDVWLLLAGFDKDGRGHIFLIQGCDFGNFNRRVVYPFDSPGYYAIGSGSYGALYMMGFKDVSAAMSLRHVAYYAFEGKYFGELAAGVGTDTDMFILRHDKAAIEVPTRYTDKALVKLCKQLRPRKLRKKQRVVMRKVFRKLKKL